MATAARVAKTNRFGDSKRFYKTDDGEFPSVTTILQCSPKPALIPWASKMERELVMRAAADLYEDIPAAAPRMIRAAYIATLEQRLGKVKAYQRELGKAMDIGTQAHARCEWLNRQAQGVEAGPEPHCRPEALLASVAYHDWLRQNDAKILHVEQVVWHAEHGYAGTMDFAAILGGKLTICDIKTGKAIYAESHVQTAAYAKAYEWMGHGKPEQGCIIRLPKTKDEPGFEVQLIPNLDELFQVFLALQQVWKWQSKNETN